MRHIQLFLRDGIAPVVYQVKVHGLAFEIHAGFVGHPALQLLAGQVIAFAVLDELGKAVFGLVDLGPVLVPHPVEKIHIAVLAALAALDAAVPRIPDIVQDNHLPLKHRVPLVSDADVVTDNLSAQGRRSFCQMQRLRAVEGYGQVGTDGTFGYLAGVGADAAGQ